ncbi:hypothetical protein [Deinococcus roseus]|uniref:Uncharacterized protein n=1 Tax=Deinococcus roseus TaxID=392414 RepID=A0ABQ2CXX4_9DEIO|nr:hypothetical protein [Deinococcus roseus]GGJ31946.1 hypothetical protein GCM10008938_17620 [Deinococcus roseus]
MKNDHMGSVTTVFKELNQARRAILQMIEAGIPAGYISLVIPERLQQTVLAGIGTEFPTHCIYPLAGHCATGLFADRLQRAGGSSGEQLQLLKALQTLGYAPEEAGFYSMMLQDAVLMVVVLADTSIQLSRAQGLARQHEGIVFHRERDPEEQNLPRPSQML